MMPFSPLEKLLLQFQRQGFAVQNEGRWRLTPKGLLLSNQLIVQLLEAQQESAPLSGRR